MNHLACGWGLVHAARGQVSLRSTRHGPQGEELEAASREPKAG